MSDAPLAANEQFITLPDGRRVCIAAHGDPGGHLVFLFHGTPASRLGHDFVDAPAKELGLRVLCPDRPGIGRSDPAPGRTIASYADDVREMALALGVRHYRAIGYSGGGPYALSVGAGKDDRVVAVATMAGAGRPDGPRGYDGLAKSDIQMLKLATKRPALARLLMRALVTGARMSPKSAIKSFAKELSEVDAKMLAEEDPKAVMAFFVEASRQGTAGPVEDYRLWAEPWGFELSDVRVPAHLWQGDADQMVPLHHAESMAVLIPNATVHRLEGEGHVTIQRHIGEILESVREPEDPGT